jgi:hypothetical protein
MRIVTYDVKQGNDYSAWYDYVERIDGRKITESTYELNTSLTQQGFRNKLRSLFNKGDNVAYISVDEDKGLFWERVII